MSRYEVTVERKVIVYDESREGAGQSAMRHFLKLEPFSRETMRVVDVKELPPVEAEARAPIIDLAPARATRA